MPTVGEQTIRQLVYPTEPPSFAVQGSSDTGFPGTSNGSGSSRPIDNSLPRYTQMDELSRNSRSPPAQPRCVHRTQSPGLAEEAIDLAELFPTDDHRLAALGLGAILGRQMEEVYPKQVLSQLRRPCWGLAGCGATCARRPEMYALFGCCPSRSTSSSSRVEELRARAPSPEVEARTDCSDWLARPCISCSAPSREYHAPCRWRWTGPGSGHGDRGAPVIHPLPVDERYVVTPAASSRSCWDPQAARWGVELSTRTREPRTVAMIETVNLTKKYGSLTALDNLNLEIEAGTCYGFIGPNGAGKTTTIKILATLLKPSWGGHGSTATWSGTRTDQAPIGYVPDFMGAYEDMLIQEYLEFFAAYQDGRRRRWWTTSSS